MTTTEARPLGQERHWRYPLLTVGLFVFAAVLRYFEVVLCLAAFVGVLFACTQAWRKGVASDRIVAGIVGVLSVVFAVSVIATTHWR